MMGRSTGNFIETYIVMVTVFVFLVDCSSCLVECSSCHFVLQLSDVLFAILHAIMCRVATNDHVWLGQVKYFK